jgi:hypothetical protein
MPGKFVKVVVFPFTTVALLGSIIRSQARPSIAHTQIMRSDGPNTQGYNQWKQMNDGLGVNDVGRSCGGV